MAIATLGRRRRPAAWRTPRPSGRLPSSLCRPRPRRRYTPSARPASSRPSAQSNTSPRHERRRRRALPPGQSRRRRRRCALPSTGQCSRRRRRRRPPPPGMTATGANVGRPSAAGTTRLRVGGAPSRVQWGHGTRTGRVSPVRRPLTILCTRRSIPRSGVSSGRSSGGTCNWRSSTATTSARAATGGRCGMQASYNPLTPTLSLP